MVVLYGRMKFLKNAGPEHFELSQEAVASVAQEQRQQSNCVIHNTLDLTIERFISMQTFSLGHLPLLLILSGVVDFEPPNHQPNMQTNLCEFRLASSDTASTQALKTNKLMSNHKKVSYNYHIPAQKLATCNTPTLDPTAPLNLKESNSPLHEC